MEKEINEIFMPTVLKVADDMIFNVNYFKN